MLNSFDKKAVRVRALLVSISAILVIALIALPSIFRARSAVPEASQTLNWSRAGTLVFSHSLVIKDLALHGQRMWIATDGYGPWFTENGGTDFGQITDGQGRDNRSNQCLLVGPSELFMGVQFGFNRSPLEPPYQMIVSNNGLIFNGQIPYVYALVRNGGDILAGTGLSIFRSSDNGNNWVRTSTGLVSGIGVHSIMVHPTGIYAGSDYNAAYKSTDNGNTWTWIANGLTAGRINDFVAFGNTILAGTGFQGVFRTTDGGQNWQHIGAGLTGNALQIQDLLIVGSDLYAATWDGVYRSTDQGVSFQPVKNGLSGASLLANALIFQNSYLYLGTEGAGLFRAPLGAQPTPTPTVTPTPTPTPTPTVTPTPTPTPTVSPTPTPTPNGRVVLVQNGAGLPGGAVTLAIQLTAQGNENTVGLSINFDPAIVSYQSSVKGSDATSLLKNELQAAQGRVGLASTVDQGQSFPPGSRQLALVTFNVVGGATATSAAIQIGDIPIPRQIVAANASNLTPGTSFLGGTISIQGGYESDVTPRPTGKNNGTINLQDYVQVGRFAIGLDTVNAAEFQRADCAPRETKGEGAVNLSDYVQAGRFATGLDPVGTVGGPTGPTSLSGGVSISRAYPTDSGRASRPRALNARKGRDAGGTRSVNVAIDALGDESAIGWSMSFNPHDWRFVGTREDIDGGKLTLNLNRASAGKVGFAFLMEPGRSLAPGHQQIAEVLFERTSTHAEPFVTGFADQPVARQMVNRNAEALTAAFNVPVDDATSPVVSVSSADMKRLELAADSLASAFGINLASETLASSSLPLPTELGGTRVSVRDSHGVERLAGLVFVSPNQVNYQVPPETAIGVATIEILGPDGAISVGVVPVNSVSPSIFSASGTGDGFAAALVAHTGAGGEQETAPVAEYDAATQTWSPKPIDSSGDGPVYLVLFATGVRGGDLIRVTIGGKEVEPQFAGPHETFAGVDQINLIIPEGLKGAGLIEVAITVSGERSNTVRLLVK